MAVAALFIMVTPISSTAPPLYMPDEAITSALADVANLRKRDPFCGPHFNGTGPDPPVCVTRMSRRIESL